MILQKLLIILFVFGVSLNASGGLKEKDVIGTWKYSVDAYDQILTGVVIFEKNEGILTGKAKTDGGETFSFTKVEIRENNVLYFELKREYDVVSATVTVENKQFNGTVGNYEGEAPITGEKVE
jgi:hypothetical protein